MIYEVAVTLVSNRLSSKSIDHGYLGFELEAEDIPILTMVWASILFDRHAKINQ